MDDNSNWEPGKEPKTPLHFCRLNGAWYFDTDWLGRWFEDLITIILLPIGLVMMVVRCLFGENENGS